MPTHQALKDSKTADTDFIPCRLFSIAAPRSVYQNSFKTNTFFDKKERKTEYLQTLRHAI